MCYLQGVQKGVCGKFAYTKNACDKNLLGLADLLVCDRPCIYPPSISLLLLHDVTHAHIYSSPLLILSP